MHGVQQKRYTIRNPNILFVYKKCMFTILQVNAVQFFQETKVKRFLHGVYLPIDKQGVPVNITVKRGRKGRR